MSGKTVIDELVTLLGFEVNYEGLDKAKKSYTDLRFIALDTVSAFQKVGQAIIAPLVDAVNYGSKIHDTALRLGIAAEALQELQIAAKISGADAETLVGGLEKLGRAASEASKGGKEQAKTFASLGMSVHDANGKLKANDVLFSELAEHLSKIPDAGKRADAAFKLVGRGVGPLLPMFEDGAAGLAELRQEAIDTGAVISQDMADAADELGDSFDLAKLRVNGLIGRLGFGLMPIAQKIINTFAAWHKENRKLLEDKIAAAVNQISGAIEKMVKAGIILWRVIDGLITSFTTWKTIAAALAVVLGVIALDLIGSMVIQVGKLAWSFIQLGVTVAAAEAIPAFLGLLFVALIGAIFLVVQDLQSADSLLKKLANNPDDAEQTGLVKFLRLAISLAQTLQKAYRFVAEGFVQVADAGARAASATANVVGSGKDGASAADAKEFGDAFSGLNLHDILLKTFINNAVDRMKESPVGPPSSAQAPIGAGALYAPPAVNLTQHFHGNTDPSVVGTAAEKGVVKGSDEAARKQLYNSGARAGYR